MTCIRKQEDPEWSHSLGWGTCHGGRGKLTSKSRVLVDALFCVLGVGKHVHTPYKQHPGFPQFSCYSHWPSNQSYYCSTPWLGCPTCGSHCSLPREDLHLCSLPFPLSPLRGAQVPTHSLLSPSYLIIQESFLQPWWCRSLSASFSKNCSTCRCLFDVFLEGEFHTFLVANLDLPLQSFNCMTFHCNLLTIDEQVHKSIYNLFSCLIVEAKSFFRLDFYFSTFQIDLLESQAAIVTSWLRLTLACFISKSCNWSVLLFYFCYPYFLIPMKSFSLIHIVSHHFIDLTVWFLENVKLTL